MDTGVGNLRERVLPHGDIVHAARIGLGMEWSGTIELTSDLLVAAGIIVSSRYLFLFARNRLISYGYPIIHQDNGPGTGIWVPGYGCPVVRALGRPGGGGGRGGREAGVRAGWERFGKCSEAIIGERALLAGCHPPVGNAPCPARPQEHWNNPFARGKRTSD